MRKRRMKLIALMLTVAVTFTSVVPVSAAGVQDSGQVLNVDESGDQGLTETDDQDIPGEGEKQEGSEGNSPVSVADEGTDTEDPVVQEQASPENGQPIPEEGTVEGSSEKQPEVVDSNLTGTKQGSSDWYKEEPGDNTVVYRKYQEGKLIEKWVRSQDGLWKKYMTETEEAGQLTAGFYVVGAEAVLGVNPGPYDSRELKYWLDETGRPAANTWKIDENHTFYYLDEDGSIYMEGIPNENGEIMERPLPDAALGLQVIDGATYWMQADSTPVRSTWQQVDGKYYYFGEDGVQEIKSGLQTIDGSKYYLEEDGTPVKSTSKIIDGYKYTFDANGKCTKSFRYYKPGWKKDSKGKRYQLEDGKYVKSRFYKVGKTTYYFNGSGYVVTGWKKISNKWYYFSSSGAMQTGLKKISGKTYYLDSKGVMKTGWQKINKKYYYFDSTGAMKTGWIKLKGTWYYLNSNGTRAEGWKTVKGVKYYLTPKTGAMKTGWYKVSGKKYYSDPSGAVKTGWLRQSNKWYYLKSNGAMAEGWVKVKGVWYYLTPKTGVMKTGWYKVSGKWYYSYSSGAMAANKWIDTYYYVGSDGAMKTDTVIDGYYVGKDGKWVPGYGTVNVNTNGTWVKKNGKYYFKKSNGKYAKNEYVAWNKNWYYLNGKGVMLTGWNYVKGYKMYFDGSGKLCQDVSGKVSGPYMIRVNRTKCQVTIFAKDGANGWTIPIKSLTCSVGNPITLTPAGTFYIGAQDRWHVLMGPSWGQWTSHVVNGIFFHSVAGSSQSQYNLAAGDYNMLGQPASHGCIRLCVRDAKWIYDNCKRGTQVNIGDNYYEPFDKPATIKLPYGINLKDPTDIW